MAITVALERLLRERGMTLSELAGRVDITLANLSILKTGKARAIRFSTLDAICRELSAARVTCCCVMRPAMRRRTDRDLISPCFPN